MSKPNWEQIQKEWETTSKTYKELEEQFNVKSSTIRSRKNREKWQRNATENATQQKKSVATKENAKKEQRYRPGSRKGAGNPNPEKKFTERNSAAMKHGFFSRYIPKETLEIMGSMNKDDPADIIWDQIMIQYAAIIRAQQIMFVEDKGDSAKELKKLKVENVIDQEGKEIQIPIEQEYEFQFAWDRHATFMNAQSRAISELRTSMKQFLEMAHDDDERRLKLEQMQVGINKTNTEIDKIKSDSGSGEVEEIIIVDSWTDSDE